MKEYDVEGTDEGYSEVEPDGVVPSWTLFCFISGSEKYSTSRASMVQWLGFVPSKHEVRVRFAVDA